MPVYFLFEVDLSMADVDVFDSYESVALPILREHGGALEARVRDAGNALEWHLVRLPDRASWQAFRDDPRRRGHAWLLQRSRARVLRYEVEPLPWPA